MAKKITSKKVSAKTASTHVEHDFITAFVIKTFRFTKKYKKELLITLLCAVVIAGGLCAYQSRQNKIEENSWKDLYMSLNFGDAQALDTVSAAYPGTNAALYAQYYKADALFTSGDYSNAAGIYDTLSQSKNKELAALSALSLASSYQALERYSSSIEAAQGFINSYPNHYAAPQAYLVLALSQDLNGDKTAALESYKIIEARYPKTYFATFATAKIKDLSKTK